MPTDLLFVWVGLPAKKQPRNEGGARQLGELLKMAEMNWVEQLKRFNARHATDKDGESYRAVSRVSA